MNGGKSNYLHIFYLLVVFSACSLKTEGQFKGDSGEKEYLEIFDSLEIFEDEISGELEIEENNEFEFECIDSDNDGHGTGCEMEEDCDDYDPDVWISCGKCIDKDNDGFFTGCDGYSQRRGPDCNDAINECTNDCEDLNSNGVADCAEGTTWVRVISTEGGDEGKGIIILSDGRFAIAGSTYRDFWLLILSEDGEIESQKTLRGYDTNIANGISYVDNMIVSAGLTNSYGAGDYDVWIVRYDSNFDISWQKTIGGGARDVANSIIRTSDGNFVIAGVTESIGPQSPSRENGWIGKIDSSGRFTWKKFLGGGNEDRIHSVAECSDGSFIAVGETKSFGAIGFDAWILKISSDGNILKSEMIGGNADDRAFSVISLSTGDVVFVGSTVSHGAGKSDAWIVKMNCDGGVIWQKTIGGMEDDTALSVVENAGWERIVLSGTTRSNGDSGIDILISSINIDGELPWNTVIATNGNDRANSVSTTNHGDIVAVGSSDGFGGSSDLVIIKLHGDGKFSGECPYISNPSFELNDSSATVGTIQLSGISYGDFSFEPNSTDVSDDSYNLNNIEACPLTPI